MATPHIVCSASYEKLREAASVFLQDAARESELLLLAPSRFAADDLVRSACQEGAFGIHRLTLTGLAVALGGPALAAEGFSPLSRLSAEAVTARVIHRLRAGSMRYFQPVADTPGLARAAAHTVAELRAGGVALRDLEATGPPGQDLARIAGGFDGELTSALLADRSTLFEHAIAVAASGEHRFTGLPLLLLDLSPRFAQEQRLLDALARRAPAVFAAALSGDRRAMTGLKATFGAPTHDLDSASSLSALERLRGRLFASASGGGAGAGGSLDFFSAAGESLECVEVARRIRGLAGAGIPFDRIAILLRSAERYQPLVEEALRRAGVPAFFCRGVARPDPAGRAFLALLTCAAEGCSARGFAEYLSLDQVPAISPPEGPGDLPAPDDELLARYYAAEPEPAAQEPADGESPPSSAGWERLLVDAAVIGGRDRWERRLRGLDAELGLQLAELDEEHESQRARLERRKEQLARLTGFALPVIDRLSALPPEANWGVWLRRLAELARMTLRRPEGVLSALAELQPMEEIGPVTPDQVTGVLSERLRFLRRDPPLRRYGRVFVGSISEARGLLFEVVFLPGLSEGQFPQRPLEDPVLLDEGRRLLEAGLELQDDRVAAERTLLHVACGAARRQLVFSYPRMDVALSRPRVPSFYALEIIRAAEGALPELRVFEERARLGAPTRLDWPAPGEAQEAIDDAEYDLAALGRTFASDPSQASASGRYLVEANAGLVRSLRARARRWRKFWSGADGLVDPEAAARGELQKLRLSARAYSPSALQHFAACPYRFLLQAVHRLEPREESVPLQQMDPLTRGALFHRAQFEFFRELAEGSRTPPPDLADQVLDRVAAEYEEQLAPAILRVWRTEIDDLRTDLRNWVRDLATRDTGWLPIHFEFGFGLAPGALRDPESTSEEAVLEGGVRLRGVIDVVERHRTRGTLRVTDYKTGRAPANRPLSVGYGAVLQPLLYAMAVEKLLGGTAESGRLWYCTQRGGYQEIEIAASAEARQRIGRVLDIIDGEIARGFLPAAPARGACSLCDYRVVCGPYEEQRVRRKTRKDLEALEELRSIP